MANADSNLTFTASPVYSFLPDVQGADVRDQLDARIAQLSAMLLLITGEGYQSFNSMNEGSQQSYLWACRMIARECEQLVDHL